MKTPRRFPPFPWITLLAVVALWVAAAVPRAVAQEELPLEIETVVPDQLNNAVTDEDGDTPAYIVLRNPNAQITLATFDNYLTDDAAVPGKWRIPNGLTFGPGQTRTIFASGKDRRELGAPLHTNFTYECDVPLCRLSQRFVFGSGTVYVPVDEFSEENPACDACGDNGRLLLGPGSLAIWHVPTTPEFDSAWFQPGFDPPNWAEGPWCFGFEELRDPLADHLVLCAPMDIKTLDYPKSTVFDVSGPVVHNGFHLGGIGSFNNPPAQIAEGLLFNGDNDAVRFEDHPDLEPGTDDLSMSIWLRPDNDKDPEIIVSKGPLEGKEVGGWLVFSNGEETILRFADGVQILDAVIPRLPAGVWSHLALVFHRKAGSVRVFVDGQLVREEGLPAPFGAVSAPEFPLFLATDSTSQLPRYRGVMDDFALWKRPLNDDEVLFVHKAGREGRSFKRDTQGEEIYRPCIDTDVAGPMRGVNTSLYLITRFDALQLAGANQLRLLVKYDDAFVAYLNGVEVARRNFPAASTPQWNSRAATDRSDPLALTPETIDITPFLPLLKSNGNVLAIHAMNRTANDERFLICPELCVGFRNPQDCIVDTIGSEFWLAFPGNFNTDDTNPLQLSLCITSRTGSTGVVEIPGLGFTRNFTIPPPIDTQPCPPPAVVDLPSEAELEGTDSVENKGIRVYTTDGTEVSVHATSRIDYSTDSYLGLPTDCIGRNYVVLGYPNEYGGVPALDGAEIGLVAGEDDTVVTITPSVATGSRPAGVPYEVHLDKGQTYQLRNHSTAGGDLSGTAINANRPVGVFGGHRCANVNSPSRFFCDHVVEQLLPVSAWGGSCWIAPLETRLRSTVRVVSAEDGTQFGFAGYGIGSLTPAPGFPLLSTTLDKGEVWEGTLVGAGQIWVEGRILVAQYARSSDDDGVVASDPFMAIVQPEVNWMNRYDFCVPSVFDFEKSFVNVIIPSSEKGTVRLDGDLVPAAAFTDIGGSGMSFARLEVTEFSSIITSHCIEAKVPFALLSYGWGEYDSYGHPGGMIWNGRPPEVVCPAEIIVYCDGPDLENCFAEVPDLLDPELDPPLVRAFDDCDPSVLLTLEQSPGQFDAANQPILLPPGSYPITITATDLDGLQGTCTTILHVRSPWAAENFPDAFPDPLLEATVWGRDADPDKDGRLNGFEEATGTDPNSPDGPDGPGFRGAFVEGGDGALYFEFTFRRRIFPSGYRYVLEGSDAMEAWLRNEFVFQQTGAEMIPGGEFLEVVYRTLVTFAPPAEPRFFVRLVIEPL